jgi:hypothetical protein
MEHRWGRRQQSNVRVRVVTTPAKICTGVVRNISITGAYLQTDARLRTLAIVYLSPIHSRSRASNCRGMAACVVRRDANGVGLEWCESLAERISLEARLVTLTGSTTGNGETQQPDSTTRSPATGRSGASIR